MFEWEEFLGTTWSKPFKEAITKRSQLFPIVWGKKVSISKGTQTEMETNVQLQSVQAAPAYTITLPWSISIVLSNTILPSFFSRIPSVPNRQRFPGGFLWNPGLKVWGGSLLPYPDASTALLSQTFAKGPGTSAFCKVRWLFSLTPISDFFYLSYMSLMSSLGLSCLI